MALHFVAVIGGGKVGDEVYNMAMDLGRRLAEKDLGIVCGGLGGVMEGVCRGAKEYGGVTVGILPYTDRGGANPYVDIVIPTGMGIGRNVLVVQSGEVVVAVDGMYGTLSEIALAMNLSKPLVVLRGAEAIEHEPFASYNKLQVANDVDECVEAVLKFISEGL